MTMMMMTTRESMRARAVGQRRGAAAGRGKRRP